MVFHEHVGRLSPRAALTESSPEAKRSPARISGGRRELVKNPDTNSLETCEERIKRNEVLENVRRSVPNVQTLVRGKAANEHVKQTKAE